MTLSARHHKHDLVARATLLSAGMMLEYLGLEDSARALTSAVTATFKQGRTLTPDQGGTSTTTDFCNSVRFHLGI